MISEGASSHRDSAWKEFLWGGLACAFGESMMHPVDTLKTRLQSSETGKTIRQVFQSVASADGMRALYRGVTPGIAGSFVTGATYFGFIEATKDWIQEKRPSIPTPWALFVAGATGDALGAVVYVPCEVIKQRMQVQGSRKTWETVVHNVPSSSSSCLTSRAPPPFEYYTGVFQAARAIGAKEGIRGLYAGLLSTLARDIPFAGLQIVFYEALRAGVLSLGRSSNTSYELSSLQELAMGGAAGGLSAFLTTPFDVIKTRMQIQSTSARYSGWLDALRKIVKEEQIAGLFKGCGPRVMWWCPASALTFMAVEKLRKQFNTKEEDSARLNSNAGLATTTSRV